MVKLVDVARVRPQVRAVFWINVDAFVVLSTYRDVIKIVRSEVLPIVNLVIATFSNLTPRTVVHTYYLIQINNVCKIFNMANVVNTVYIRSYKVKVKWSRYRPGVAQTMRRDITLLFLGRGTRRGWVVSSTPWPHFTPGKEPVPILQEAGGPQGRSGRAENLVPTGIRSRTVQHLVSRYTDWATRPTSGHIK